MNRRTALRNVVFISAGAAILPSCLHEDKPAAYQLKNFSLSARQEKMLADLADAILPSSSKFIGAKDLRSHEFVLTMVDDCRGPEDQKKFVDGLTSFDDACKKTFNKSFSECNGQQRLQFLKLAEANQPLPQVASEFYGMAKGYTIQSFATCKEYLVDVRKFTLVPGGNYKGCVPIAKAG